MKVFKMLVLATIVAVSGCASLSETLVKTDKEVAKLLDNICLNLSDSMRDERRASINGFTKVATLSNLNCE